MTPKLFFLINDRFLICRFFTALLKHDLLPIFHLIKLLQRFEGHPDPASMTKNKGELTVFR